MTWLALSRPRRLWRAAAVALVAAGLCTYALAPARAAGNYLPMARAASTIAANSWLTPLAGLLAPGSVPPVPRPSRGAELLPGSIHPAVGWPLLAGAAAVAGLLLRGARVPRRSFVLLAIFGAGLVAAWSPFDFWSHLPALASLAQFPYRLLTLTMWSGALLLATGLTLLLPRAGAGAALLAGILLVGVSAAPYLVTAPALNGDAAADALRRGQAIQTPTDPLTELRGFWIVPPVESARKAYAAQIDDFLVEPALAGFELPQAEAPTGGVTGEVFALGARTLASRPMRLVALRSPADARALSVRLRVGGQALGELAWAPGAASVSTSLRPLVSPAAGRLPFDLRVVAADGSVTSVSAEWLLVPEALRIEQVVAPAGLGRFYPAAASVQDGPVTRVSVAGHERALVVLPVQFHPDMLRVRIDGVAQDYLAFGRAREVLAAVVVEAGRHVIEVRFVGLAWANAVSLAFLAALAPLAWLVSRARRRGLPRPQVAMA